MTLSRFEALRKKELFFFVSKSRDLFWRSDISKLVTHTHERGQVQVKWHESRLGNILSFWKIRENWLQVRDHEFLTTNLWKGALGRHSRDFWLLHPSGASSDIVRKWERPSNTVFAMGKSERCFRRIGSRRGLGQNSHTLPEIKLFYCLEREKSESVQELREKHMSRHSYGLSRKVAKPSDFV